MIKCTICQNRIRPPTRPWSEVDGGVHFYQTTSDMKAYARWLAKLAKKIPFVHKACLDKAEPGMMSQPFVIALDLDAGLRRQQRRG